MIDLRTSKKKVEATGVVTGRDWTLHRRIYKKPARPRLKRRERLNWHQWFADWYLVLKKLGFTCCNPAIKSTQTKITAKGMLNERALYMQRGAEAVYLYSSAQAVPKTGTFELGVSKVEPPKTITRIVQGRRVDKSRGVCRSEDGTATNIISDIDIKDKAQFLVDFDEGLFELDVDGVWKETKEGSAAELYKEYHGVSPHYQSIRPYRVKDDLPRIEPEEDEISKTNFATNRSCFPEFKPFGRLVGQDPNDLVETSSNSLARSISSSPLNLPNSQD